MALFYKAEAGEASENRPPHVVAAYVTAAEIALQNDDEVWGCLGAWNAVKAVKSAGTPYLIGELLAWLDHAYDCKHKLASWHGDLLIASRLDVCKHMKGDIKVGVGVARRMDTCSPDASILSTSPARRGGLAHFIAGQGAQGLEQSTQYRA
jgi:hypothetical protein